MSSVDVSTMTMGGRVAARGARTVGAIAAATRRPLVNAPFVGSARSWLADFDVPPERLALSNARRVVIKVGTAVVSNSDGTLALSRLGALVEQVYSRHAKPAVR